MKVRIHRPSLLLAVSVVAGCAETSRFEPSSSDDRLGVWAPDAAATFLRTSVSGLDNPTLAVVSDVTTWRVLWAQAWAGAQQPPPLPQVDFVLSSVLAVGLGKRAGPGYAVSIDSVVVHTTSAVLFATAVDPGAGCASTGGASAPVHLVHAPGHPPVADWRIATTRRGCAP